MVADPTEVGARALARLTLADRPIGLVDMHDDRRVPVELGFAVGAIRDHDDPMARLDETRAPAVQDHVAALTFHCIGLEPRTVVDVEDRDLLELVNVGERHEISVERDGADVVNVGTGNDGAVDLRLHHRALHIASSLRIPRSADASAPRTESEILSMRRVCPTRAASATSTSPSMAPAHGVRSSAPRHSRYSMSTAGSVPRTRVASPRIASVSRSPARTRRAAASNARERISAASRCAGDRYALRLDIASPSGSRTSGQPTTSTGRSRSATMRVITASCWASLRPKNARHGPAIANSLATTVVTPSKCVGRAAPQRPSVSPAT